MIVATLSGNANPTSAHPMKRNEDLISNEMIKSAWCYRSATVVAPDLIGCTLVRQLPSGEMLRGLIVETEAYTPDDPACHAYRGKTESNAAMFGPAGMAYVYLIYGMYHCLNVVTDAEGVGSAVLLRALALETLPVDLSHDPKAKPLHRLASGPGKICRVLQLNRTHNHRAFAPDNQLWLEHRTDAFQHALTQGEHSLVQTTRIGISKAIDLPYRWYLKAHPAVSKP
jgi:DNA-3-methyladenine glycosylase